MHVGIVGPCSSGPLAEYLPECGGIDIGCDGYPPVVNVVRALLKHGHHVSVITLSPELSDRRILKGPNLTYYVYPTRLKKRMRDLYKIERQGLKEGILLAKPDLLHAHWTYEYALACLETGFPTLVTCHDNGFQILRFARDLARVGRLYLQIRVIRQARFLTAVSPYLADSLNWLAKAGVEMIPNIVEVSQEYKNQNDREEERPRIATILHGWQMRKNPRVAIKAFNLLRRHLAGAEMFMYGNDFQEGGVAWKWARGKGLHRNIRFRGPLPHKELQAELTGMSLLLHPALEESFGMAICEAMALSLPVVAGVNSGAVRWVLDEGRAGFLTNVRKPKEVAETLLTCIQQKEDREQKRKAGYNRVLNSFSPDSIVKEYERIYGQILSSP
jgi:glycosyltransferase involved in cell wall biosynthesis